MVPSPSPLGSGELGLGDLDLHLARVVALCSMLPPLVRRISCLGLDPLRLRVDLLRGVSRPLLPVAMWWRWYVSRRRRVCGRWADRWMREVGGCRDGGPEPRWSALAWQAASFGVVP